MKRKILGLSLIFCLAIVLFFTSVFATRGAASAENVDVLVNLTNDSLLTAYGDCFAYTNGKNVYLVKDNKTFEGKSTSDFDYFVDIAMNSKYVLALVQKGNDKYLWAYEYNTLGITKTKYDFTDKLDCDYLVEIYAGEDDTFFVMENNAVKQITLPLPTENVTIPSFFPLDSILEDGAYKNTQAFVILNGILYCIIDGDFYVIDQMTTIHPDDLPNFRKRTGEYVDLAVVDEKILLLDANNVYEFESAKSSDTILTATGLNSNSKICSAYNSKNDVNYVYVKSNLNAVNMYLYESGTLDYYGCFDSTKYEHPKEYEIVKLYKTDTDVTLYSSPRHLQRMGVIPNGSYFIELSERDEYIYAYYQNPNEDKPQLGYIKKTANVTLCPANRDGEFGAFVQPLHEETPIYKYPFEGSGSEKILDASIFMQLTFIDNVGQDGDFSWGWYKVGYVDNSGNTKYGYVKSNNLSPYTPLTAPSLSKSVKLTSKKLGQYITLYALPFENEEDAIEVTQLPEGTVVYLKEKYNRKSQWTAVYYEGKTAYVRTANVKASGLTSWQLALAITIPCVIVAIAIATTLIILAKKKKRVYNFY